MFLFSKTKGYFTQPTTVIETVCRIWLALSPSHPLSIIGLTLILFFMARRSASLTESSTQYCAQRASEVTAVTGFHASTCYGMILIWTINYKKN